MQKHSKKKIFFVAMSTENILKHFYQFLYFFHISTHFHIHIIYINYKIWKNNFNYGFNVFSYQHLSIRFSKRHTSKYKLKCFAQYFLCGISANFTKINLIQEFLKNLQMNCMNGYRESQVVSPIKFFGFLQKYAVRKKIN